MTTIENAAAVLGTAAPLPDATVSAGSVAPSTAPADQVLPELDRDKARHDPAIHETPARLNSEKRWARLRGNAARKAKGLPPSYGTRSTKPAAPSDPAATPAAGPTTPPPAAPGVSTPPPDDLLRGPVHDGVPAPEGPVMNDLASYATTAGGVVDGTLGLAQMGISDAWKASPQERTILVGAVQRVWHEHQWPILGAVAELVLVVIGFVAKRRSDEPTMALVRRIFRREDPKPKPVDPHAPVESVPVPPRVVITRPARSSVWD